MMCEELVVNGQALLSHTQRRALTLTPETSHRAQNSSCTSAERALLFGGDRVQGMKGQRRCATVRGHWH
ncbi:hypothetical protein AOLI_G00070950 [Acnodon oligacanthus]